MPSWIDVTLATPLSWFAHRTHVNEWAGSSRRRDPRDNKRGDCRDDDVKNQRTEPNVEGITDTAKVNTCERLRPIAPRGPRSPDNSGGPTQQ